MPLKPAFHTPGIPKYGYQNIAFPLEKGSFSNCNKKLLSVLLSILDFDSGNFENWLMGVNRHCYICLSEMTHCLARLTEFCLMAKN